MSMKYELSLWREYPGAHGIQEEKVCIIAATDMGSVGRAQNIKLKRESNGKQTLTFEIPIKYFDINSGEDISNPLIEQVIDHSKLKLWRDEKWLNQFYIPDGKTLSDITDENGITHFETKWEQGRWYEFVVTQRSQKRSSKKIMYSYSCDSLFMNELSRTGYNLEFVPDTDIMSANGMGTAHDLAKRIVDGTDWNYVKTEIFPDYKEEYNEVSGETVRTPVSTDQIEFAGGLNRYVYCYTFKALPYTDKDGNNITAAARAEEIITEIEELASEQKLKLTRNVDFGFDEDYVFWWKPKKTDEKKKYLYGYNKTDIITNYADKILCYTDGLIETISIDNATEKQISTKKVNEATLLSSSGLWETMNGAVINIKVNDSGESVEPYNYDGITTYQLEIKNTTKNKPILYNSGYSDKPLEKGQNIIFNLSGSITGDGNLILYIYDGEPANDSNGNDCLKFNLGKVSDNKICFYNSYIITLPKRIANPYFAFGYSGGISNATMVIQSLLMYNFVGFTEEIDKAIKEWISTQPTYANLLSYSNLVGVLGKIGVVIKEYDYIIHNSNYSGADLNLCEINNTIYPIWIPIGTIAQNDYKSGIDVYEMELFRNNQYYDIFPTAKSEELTKITSYDTDKRRAISGSKSNRYSLLETVNKTFFCFTRFIVEHTDDGYVKTDMAGRPLKYFTLVSELGRRNFNGFTYGVNLKEVERKIESGSLVTKVYVQEIDNQYNNSGVVSIQNSSYNKMGEKFFYNFSYFARQGFFNNSKFMKDYADLVDFVSLNNAKAKSENEKYISKNQYKQTLQTVYNTHNLLKGSYFKQATEELENLKWPRLEEYLKSNHIIVSTTFPKISWSGIANNLPVELIKQNPTPYEKIAAFMYYTRYSDSLDGSEAWYGNGNDDTEIENSLRSVAVLQTQYINIDSTLATEEEELNTVTEEVNKLLDNYNSYIEQKNNKLTWFENKYSRFILEGLWSGNDYIDPDIYYIDATRAMSTSCMPRVSYSMNVVDLSKVANPYNPEDEDWGKDFTFDVGDTTYIKDEEMFGKLEQKSMISDITSYIDLNKPDDLTLKNFETRFEELFQSIAAAVTTLQLNENIYSRAENFTASGTIDTTILQKSFMENKDLVFSSSNNKVTQDNYGITIRTTDNSGDLLRAIASGIFISSDNGKSFTAGLTAKGMNAALITAGQLDTSKVVIRSGETPQYVLDSLGLTAYSVSADSSNNMLRESSFVRFDQFGVYATDNGRLFGKDWYKTIGNDISKLYQTTLMDNVFSAEGRLEYGITPTTAREQAAKEEIDALVQEQWTGNNQWIAIFLEKTTTTPDYVRIVMDSYYRNEYSYDGEYYKLIGKNWIPGNNWSVAGGGIDLKRQIYYQNYKDDTDGKYYYYYYLVLFNPKEAKEFIYQPGGTGHICKSGWDGEIKLIYTNKIVTTKVNSGEDYIEENSIFSLTRNGLVINSNGGHGGACVKISTKDSAIFCLDSNQKTRVKMGFIRNEDNEDVYGLDIYDGCFAIYNKAFGEDKNEKILYTERDTKDTSKVNLFIKGQINATGGNIGNWKIENGNLYSEEKRISKVELNAPTASSTSFNFIRLAHNTNKGTGATPDWQDIVTIGYDDFSTLSTAVPVIKIGSYNERFANMGSNFANEPYFELQNGTFICRVRLKLEADKNFTMKLYRVNADDSETYKATLLQGSVS